MLNIEIPGFKKLHLKHLVLDYNGTLATDGFLNQEIKDRLNRIINDLDIHIVTADTFGRITQEIEGLNCILSLLGSENQAKEKQKYVQKLGSKNTVAIGNGRNDRLMLKEAELGIVVVQREGAAVESLIAADVAVTDIITALDLLEKPFRLTATLRS